MPKQNRKFGDWGEKLAEEFLRERGYEILEKNFQKQVGEIDIVAQKDNTLHFVEVKTRTIASIKKFGAPAEAVTVFKQKKILHTALSYIAENNAYENINWQIDVVSIVCACDGRKIEISILENVFDGIEP